MQISMSIFKNWSKNHIVKSKPISFTFINPQIPNRIWNENLNFSKRLD